uniref:Uncharacterized protein n=1 Tax=Neolamprologus brichardi TaxID=32507 RepID=A0A3Q4I8E8_NEOBR
MPGILPTRLTTILSLLFPVRTFTALLMVMLSRLTPFTSTSLSPTVSPASAADTGRIHCCVAMVAEDCYWDQISPSTGALMRMTLPMGEEDLRLWRCFFTM